MDDTWRRDRASTPTLYTSAFFPFRPGARENTSSMVTPFTLVIY